MFSIPLAAAVAATILWASEAIVVKYVSTRTKDTKPLIVYTLGVMVATLLGFLLFSFAPVKPLLELMSAAGGIFLIGFYILFFKAMKKEMVSNISIFNAFQALLLSLFAILVLGESLTLLNAILMAGIFAGVVMTTYDRKAGFNRHLIVPAAAFTSAAIYWFLVSYAIKSSGDFVVPFFISRVVATVFLLAYYARMGSKNSAPSKIPLYSIFIFLGLLGGLFDGLGNLLFGITVNGGLLAIGSALTALIPLIVAIAAWKVYSDRLDPLQMAGIALAVICSVLIALL
jgi:drug/metabolite transporter (DMT)-like permease